MNRADAARRLVQLLSCDVVSDLLDAAGDIELRDRVQKVLSYAGSLAFDADEARKMDA